MGVPYQAAVSGQPTKNKGGTVKKAGAANTTTGPITKTRTLMQDAVTTPYGTNVALSSGAAYSSGNLGTFNAKTTFAYQQAKGSYLMKRYTQKVNGVADTYLTSGASSSSERMRAIPSLEAARSLGSGVSTSWDYETGAITKGTGAGESRSFVNPIGGGASLDSAARPTNAVPGELTYKTGAKLPVNNDYKPKTAP
jgi:hypothetical protein